MIQYDMSAMYACYVQVYNFGESPSLVVMLSDFYQNCGLRPKAFMTWDLTLSFKIRKEKR